MAQTIQSRHDTAVRWTAANPVLAEGEIGVETDTFKAKVGNGIAAYASLPYLTGAGGGGATSYVGLSDAASVDLVATNPLLAASLGLKAPLASPTLTGVPLAPTAAAATNTTQIATTAHVFAERTNAATLSGKTMSGSSNTFTNLPANSLSGIVPIANLATGTPTGAKFIRDDGTLQAIAGGGDALTTGTLGQFAATTSAQLATVLSDEVGTGFFARATDTPLLGTPTAPTAAAATNTTQLATTAHVFAERANTFTMTNKTLTSPTITAPTITGTMAGTATMPSTHTMAASPSAGDNSLKVATTAYVDTGLALKVTINAAAAITGANTLVQATHFNRHVSWTGASTAAQAISTTATAGDYIEVSNDGTAVLTFTGATIAAGFRLDVNPGETFQALYSAGAWVSLTPIAAYLSLINSQSVAYTYVAADAGKTILHPAADTTARTWTMPANSSVAYPIGTVIKVRNQNSAGVLTLAITTDTQTLVGAAGSTGSRTLAAGGEALYQKETATTWSIRGSAELT